MHYESLHRQRSTADQLDSIDQLYSSINNAVQAEAGTASSRRLTAPAPQTLYRNVSTPAPMNEVRFHAHTLNPHEVGPRAGTSTVQSATPDRL